MNATKFLKVGGFVFIIAGILGFIGILGPTSERSIFGSMWWFDNTANWAHVLIGIIAVKAGYWYSHSVKRSITLIIGIVAVIVGLYSVYNQNFMGVMLEHPMDTIFYLVVGAWALASTGKK